MTKQHAVTPAAKPKGKKAERLEPEDIVEFKSITTAIHIPESTWKLLRAVAFHRAQDRGGRASVSKLIAELVERRPSLVKSFSAMDKFGSVCMRYTLASQEI